MGRNKNYKRAHLLLVLETCENWPTFSEAYAYIVTSTLGEVYQPGLYTIHSWGLQNFQEIRDKIHRCYKEYDYA